MKLKAKWDNEGHWKKGQEFEIKVDDRGLVYIQCDEGRHNLTDRKTWEFLLPENIAQDDQFEPCK